MFYLFLKHFLPYIYKTIKIGFRIWEVSFKQTNKKKNWWPISLFLLFLTWFSTLACRRSATCHRRHCRSPVTFYFSLSLLPVGISVCSSFIQCRVCLFHHSLLIASCHCFYSPSGDSNTRDQPHRDEEQRHIPHHGIA